MKKSLQFAAVAVIAALSLVSCASAPAAGPSGPVASGGPFPVLEQKALDLGNDGVIAALGMGVDNTGRYDFALEKAKMNGRSMIAQQYESTVATMASQFAEQLSGSSSGGGTELSEHFKQATTNVAKKTLNGVRVMSVTQQLKEGNKITVGVVMGVDAKVLNASLLDEVQAVDPKLYERFRASQAYEELKKETEGMGKK